MLKLPAKLVLLIFVIPMMKKVFFIAFLAAFLSVRSQEVELVTIEQLQDKITKSDQSLTVINFWATWCKPCIEEMPYFQELDESNEDIKVYLVSVDFQNQIERVKAFVKKRSVTSDVLFLNEKDPDNYMPKISRDWTGAIPATLFVDAMGKTYFHEKAFSKEELFETAKKYVQ